GVGLPPRDGATTAVAPLPGRQPALREVGLAAPGGVIRVLVAHHRYRSSAPSGENETVDAEVALLREGGHEVVTMVTDSDDLRPGAAGLLRAAPGPVYAPSGVRRFRRLVHDRRPDVVHLHNVYPLISPWVVRVADRAGVPVVQTV